MDEVKDQPEMPPSTANALEERISALAVECGIVLKDGHAGFAPDSPPDTEGIPEEAGYAEAVWPWRRLMAECVNYLSIQSLVFMNLLLHGSGEPSNFLRASWSLSTKAASDARCALHLCDHGFSAQAGIVARSCVEAIEALAAFTLDPDAADVFVSAETLDDSNHVWFNVIRKKARRTMDDAFAKVVEIDQPTAEWRRHNRRLLGAMTHPSYLTPMLNLFSDWEGGKDAYPMLPARTTNSVKVFHAVADSCFEYASLVLLTLLGPRDPNGRDIEAETGPYKNVGFFEDDWLDSYAALGHKFLQRLWIFFLLHQDHPPFSLWHAGTDPAEEDDVAGQ